MTPTPHPDDLEVLVGRIADEFTDRIQRGERPDVEEYARRHPAVAGVLRDILPAVQALGSSADGIAFDVSPPAPPPAAIGIYEVLKELGRGGMGVVYLARDRRLDRLVALKLLRPGSEDRERFLLEGKAAARLRHPHIVTVHEVGEHNGHPYLALEYIAGGSLAEYLTAHRFSPHEAASLIANTADAVQRAHESGIVHRDIKPGNILLTGPHPGGPEDPLRDTKLQTPGSRSSGNDRMAGLSPKVTDFGLAKRLDDGVTGQTRSGAIVGTPGYMAPEQAGAGGRLVGPAADIYALGAVLYECLTGKPPFSGSSTLELLEQVRSANPVPPRRLEPSIPRDLETICLKCLRKEPSERYSSAGELADDLRRFLDGRPVVARPLGPVTRMWRLCKRQPAVAGLIALMVLLVPVGMVTFALLWWKAEVNLKLAAQREQDLDQALRYAEEQRLLAEDREERERESFVWAQEAVDEMLTQVGEGLEDVPHASLVRRSVLEKALELQQKFLAQRSDDPAVRIEVVRSYRRMARIHLLLGDVEAGEEAVEAGRRVLKISLASPDRDLEEARLASLRSETHSSRLGHAEAVQESRSALATLERLVARRPDDLKLRMETAQAALQCGLYSSRFGQFSAAEVQYDSALRHLAVLPEANAEVRHMRARLHNRLGSLMRASGRMPEAQRALRAAEQILGPLLVEYPTIRRYRQELASTEINLANLLVSLGRQGAEEALEYYNRSLERYRKLSEDFRNDPGYRAAQASCLFGRGLAHVRLNYLVPGRADYEASVRKYQELQAKFAEKARYQEDELRVRLNLYDLCVLLNELPAAGECLARLETLADAIRQANPDSTDTLYLQGTVIAKRAIYSGLQQDYEKALEDHLLSSRLLREVRLRVPASSRYRDAYLRNLRILGSTLKRMERYEDLYRAAEEHTADFSDEWQSQYTAGLLLCWAAAVAEENRAFSDQATLAAVRRLNLALQLSAMTDQTAEFTRLVRAGDFLAPLQDRPPVQAFLAGLPPVAR